jgi:hypothetical protein
MLAKLNTIITTTQKANIRENEHSESEDGTEEHNSSEDEVSEDDASDDGSGEVGSDYEHEQALLQTPVKMVSAKPGVKVKV